MATDFSKAWTDHTKSPRRPDEIVEIMRGAPESQQVLSSVETFPTRLRSVAPQLAQHHSSDHGPFPLCHPDFLYSNIIVAPDGFDVLGIIDWEGACTLPFGLVQFPCFLDLVPRRLGRADRFGDNGQPRHEDERQQWTIVCACRWCKSTRTRKAVATIRSQSASRLNMLKIYHTPWMVSMGAKWASTTRFWMTLRGRYRRGPCK
jgi:hypothetical protein